MFGEVFGVRGDCWVDGFVFGFLREEVVVGVNKISVYNDEVGFQFFIRFQKDFCGGFVVWFVSQDFSYGGVEVVLYVQMMVNMFDGCEDGLKVVFGVLDVFGKFGVLQKIVGVGGVVR